MKMLICVKDLTIVHRYQGGVYRYYVGNKVEEITLIRNGINPNSEYFKEI